MIGRLRDELARRRFDVDLGRALRPSRFAAYGASTVWLPPLEVDHPERVSIGAGTQVMKGASVTLGPAGTFRVGDRTYLGRDLTVIAFGSVEVGDDILGSDRLVLADTGPAPAVAGLPVRDQALAEPQPVVIEDGVFLGTGAVVTAGVRVGARSFVGAGAVVTRDVPPNSVVVGNPARIVRHHDSASGTWVDGPPAS